MGQHNKTFFALFAALFGALAIAAPVAVRGTPPAPTPALTSIGSRPENQRLPDSGKRPFDILNEFLGLNDDDAFRDWDSATDPRAGYTVEFLIATLPEPLEASFRYKFDTYLDAIQRAAEASGFVLDRFDLPWGDPTKSTPPLLSTSAQDLPGILLFRSRQTGKQRLLLVFLIGETPTWGVRKKPLLNSLDWIELQLDDATRPKRFPHIADRGSANIPIMGPSFSGSAESLRLGIGAWLAQHPRITPSITTISGTATAIDLAQPFPLARESFRATRMSLPEQTTLMQRYLVSMGAKSKNIAILSETGTSFGVSVRHQGDRDDTSGSRHSKESPADESLYLQFPLHISNLRGAMRTTSASSSPQLDLQSRNLSLSEDQNAVGGYVVPLFSQRTTVYDELTLNLILDSIHRRRIDYIEIATTDVEDLIFLAQTIRARCPDTVLISSTADLRFLHTDVNSDLRGMLVFSPYPLFLPNQSWSYPFSGEHDQLQFPSDNAEGVYNATVALLNKQDAPLLDYSSPFAADATTPPLWLSIVGNDSLWPVTVLRTRKLGDHYVYSRNPTQAGFSVNLSPALFPRSFLLVLSALTVFCAGGCLLVFKESVSDIPSNSPPAGSWLNSVPRGISMIFGEALLPEYRSSRRLLQLSYVTILAALNIIVILFFMIPVLPNSGISLIVRPEVGHSVEGASWTPSGLVYFLSLMIAPLLLFELYLALKVFQRALIKSGAVYERLGVLAISSLGLGSVGSVAMLIMKHPSQEEISSKSGLFLLMRSVNLGSGVSPLVPILLVGGAGLLLTLCSLRRLSLLEECSIPSPFLNFKGPSFEGVFAKEGKLRSVLECGPFWLPGSRLIIPLLLAVMWLALRRGRPSYPIDGFYFDWVVRIVSFLVYAAFTLAFLRFLSIWVHLKRLLVRLYWHPGRAGYESLRESLPGDTSEKKKIYLMEGRPSGTAAEASLNLARGIMESLKVPSLGTSIRCAERCLDRQYKAFESGTSKEFIESRTKTVRALALVSGTVTSIFDSRWRSAPPVALFGRRFTDSLTEQANLFAASRVVDLLRQVMPQLQNLATFGTASMLLMLFAMSSYPFPQRDTLLWVSWSTLLGAVLILLIVFVQIRRDRIMSFLSGTVPGKLNWDAGFVAQIVIFGVVPILSLLGAQFPDTFRQLFSWAAKINGGH